jgi:hypothetical protein
VFIIVGDEGDIDSLLQGGLELVFEPDAQSKGMCVEPFW